MLRTAILVCVVTLSTAMVNVELAAQQTSEGQKSAADTHWAFRRFGTVRMPSVQTTRELRSPIDAFVAARLEAVGLDFAADADRRTRVRRLYLDLLGIPPTMEQTAAALRDVRPGSWERLVDRVLASPRFGERWARHWLDVLGYADTIGFDMNPDSIILSAGKWRFRDYVIRSLNSDKPYDVFIRQQLAGDEAVDWRNAETFTPEIMEHLVATGYLRTAQDFTHEPISDIPSNHYAVIHDTLEIVGASLFAVTLKCARCHDHKYDPFPQMDYYRLMACLTPAYNSKKWKAVIPYREGVIDRSLPAASRRELAEIKRHNERLTGEVAAVKQRIETVRQKWMDGMFGTWHQIGPFPATESGKAFDQMFAPEKQPGRDVGRDSGENVSVSKNRSWRKRPEWKDGIVHDLVGQANTANYVYRTIDVATKCGGVISLGSDDGIKLWLNGKLVFSKDVRRGAAADQEKVTLPLGAGRNHLLLKVANIEGGHAFYFRPVSLDGLPPHAEVAKLESQVKQLESRRRSAEKIQALWDVGPAPATYLHIRGNHERPGVEVSPGFLSVLDARAGQLNPQKRHETAGASKSSESAQGVVQIGSSGRRTALADWVTRRDTPASALLARVAVNRIWMHLFGEGLVASAGNFGAQGTPPTHPALLEWLSADFEQGGWSVKRVVRHIVTSTTYRQSSQQAAVSELARAESIDPANRLLWRMRLRRVDAEVIRDSLLAVGGTLDARMGGPAIHSKTNLDGRVVVEAGGRRRRSIYLLVRRAYNPSLLSVFDQPVIGITCSQRQPSAVVSQSLMMLNDAFLAVQAQRFAERVRGMAGAGHRRQIDIAFRIALARPPTETERSWCKEHLDRQQRLFAEDDHPAVAALVDLCHAILNTSEFLYVE